MLFHIYGTGSLVYIQLQLVYSDSIFSDILIRNQIISYFLLAILIKILYNFSQELYKTKTHFIKISSDIQSNVL